MKNKSRIYSLNIIKIGNKKFIKQDNALQCAFCLFKQPTVVNEKWIKDEDGCYIKAYLELQEEQHSDNCKQK